MKKFIITICCIIVIQISGCVNDPEKHTESEVDPEMKDTVTAVQKTGGNDTTVSDTTSQNKTATPKGQKTY